jgi:hypothetical protein
VIESGSGSLRAIGRAGAYPVTAPANRELHGDGIRSTFGSAGRTGQGPVERSRSHSGDDGIAWP